MKQELDPKMAIGICVAVLVLVGGFFVLKNMAFRGKPDTSKAEAAGAKMMESMQRSGGMSGGQNQSPYGQTINK